MSFQPECYFDCEGEIGDGMGAHVTFKSGHEAFICEEHVARANELDQLTEIRLVVTGIERVMRNYERTA